MTRPELSGETEGKRAAAAAILAGGGTATEAAQAASVNVRTVARWRQDPAFLADVRTLTSQALDGAARRLARSATGAAAYLGAVAEGEADGDPVRINAARLVLTLAPQLRDAVELEARISALEAVTGLAAPANVEAA